MEKALTNVREDHIPYELVARKFRIPGSTLQCYLYEKFSDKSYTPHEERVKIMSTLADEASKNAKHWVKKAVDEGYVTVRELRFYRKYGSTPELISQCLVNDDGDEGMERHTSACATENHDEFKAKGETKLTSTHLKVMKGAVAAAQAGGMRWIRGICSI